ncbi:hypothetical protein ACRTEP_21095 [Vibrio diabolicus]|uniref:hypothetical protein n=1 Tax=Vibrio diabolicus TaxID=50719 RepID=UPI003D7D3A3E
MKKHTFPLNDKGHRLEVTKKGATLTFTVFLNGHVGHVSISEDYEKEEAAKAALGEINDHNVKQVMSKFSFSSAFTKQMINALSNAKKNGNTKKATELDYRAYGSDAYGRNGIRNTATGRTYPKR